MPLIPGRLVVNTEVRIAANFQDETDTDIDPDTVTFKLLRPDGVDVEYVYVTDPEVVRIDTGDYYVNIVPDISGRYFYRWETTGAYKTIAFQGSFVVQVDPWAEGRNRAYGD